MKKYGILFLVSVAAAILVWSSSASQEVHSNALLAVTNTPAAQTPTQLPTEELTSTPTLQPTNTLVPSLTPTLPATATPTLAAAATLTPTSRAGAIQPTPKALPPMGLGDFRPDAPDFSSPVSRIQIPALKLDSTVQRVPLINGTWDISNLALWVGWLETTSKPELGGNTVLVGHLDMKGGAPGPFYKLEQLEPGMVIVVYSGEDVYTYRVTQKVVTDSSDISTLGETHNPRLTLITCFQPSWDASARVYRQRLVVIAELDSIVR